jgi:hypothetical protein
MFGVVSLCFEVIEMVSGRSAGKGWRSGAGELDWEDDRDRVRDEEESCGCSCGSAAGPAASKAGSIH